MTHDELTRMKIEWRCQWAIPAVDTLKRNSAELFELTAAIGDMPPFDTMAEDALKRLDDAMAECHLAIKLARKGLDEKRLVKEAAE